MTEAEWLASGDPVAMGAVLARRKRASTRVLRLAMAAFWSWQAHRLKAAEQNLLRQRAAWVEEWADTGTAPAESNERPTFVFYNRDPKAGFLSTISAPRNWADGGPASARAVWVLREVFGNPFATRRKRKTDPRRGWMFDSAWRTDTVVTLARQMYDSLDFSAMPILADALEDAGCDNADILHHCRDRRAPPRARGGARPAHRPGEHVRGCWVLDLILSGQERPQPGSKTKGRGARTRSRSRAATELDIPPEPGIVRGKQ
jgi:hypothetical protein